jgi:hypothetical protein
MPTSFYIIFITKWEVALEILQIPQERLTCKPGTKWRVSSFPPKTLCVSGGSIWRRKRTCQLLVTRLRLSTLMWRPGASETPHIPPFTFGNMGTLRPALIQVIFPDPLQVRIASGRIKSMKNPNVPFRIEPAFFLFAAQWLNSSCYLREIKRAFYFCTALAVMLICVFLLQIL